MTVSQIETKDQNPNLISNYMKCGSCQRTSPESDSWLVVQYWWRNHGYGQKCGAEQ